YGQPMQQGYVQQNFQQPMQQNGYVQQPMQQGYVQQQPVQNGAWFCPNCGTQNTSKFCSGCGSPKQ
ncbi:MAG: SPFH domain-containing protein, partial [Eubacterium sp.]